MPEQRHKKKEMKKKCHALACIDGRERQEEKKRGNSPINQAVDQGRKFADESLEAQVNCLRLTDMLQLTMQLHPASRCLPVPMPHKRLKAANFTCDCVP